MHKRVLVSVLSFALPFAASAADHQVLLGAFTFSPSRLEVQAGDTVTWINTGGFHSVTAEDGSFSSGDAASDDSSVWPFSHRFGRPGSFPYFCIPHALHGMRGVIDVSGPDHPGVPELSQSSLTVSEADGEAVVTVRRARGATGAISVAFAARVFSTNPGNATPGTDFSESFGTLHWADGEIADRSFAVPIHDDFSLEDEETLALELSAPEGGATLDPQTRRATLRILDDDASVPLAATAVACDAARLSGLLARAAVEAPGAATPGLNLSLTASGDFVGLAYAASGPAAPERHLAFSTNPEETPLLRNPSRPQLPSLSLTRNALRSDLVARGQGEVRLALNAALDSGAPALLRIDNVEGAGGQSADAKPGRGLASLLDPCHGRFSPRDVHVFRVLAQLARSAAAGSVQSELAIFRGESPDTYRIDIFPLGPDGSSRGRLAVEVIARYGAGAGGGLVDGSMKILGRCSAVLTTHCTNVTGFTELLLVPPTASGQATPPAAARISTLGTEGDGQPTDEIDWQTLLAGTTWRQ